MTPPKVYPGQPSIYQIPNEVSYFLEVVPGGNFLQNLLPAYLSDLSPKTLQSLNALLGLSIPPLSGAYGAYRIAHQLSHRWTQKGVARAGAKLGRAAGRAGAKTLSKSKIKIISRRVAAFAAGLAGLTAAKAIRSGLKEPQGTQILNSLQEYCKAAVAYTCRP